MKICSKCKTLKNLEDFPPDKRNKSGVSSCCRKCSYQISKVYKQNSVRFKSLKQVSDRKYYVTNHTVIRDKQVEARLLSRYGITKQDFDSMFEQQNGCCIICNRHASEFKKGLHVDHCHKTDIVRGLLCPGCNTSLGMLENETWMRSAYAYLKRVQ